jgi:hypothetical protein
MWTTGRFGRCVMLAMSADHYRRGQILELTPKILRRQPMVATAKELAGPPFPSS